MDFSKLWDDAVLGHYKIQDPSFINLVNSVLGNIPDKFEEDFPTFCMYQRETEWCAYLDIDNNILFDVEKINLQSKGADNVIIGIIAEILALLFIKSKMPNLRLVSGESLWVQSVQLATEWGFSEELEEYHNVLGRVTLFELPNRPDIYG